MITTATIVDYDGDCLTLRPDGYIDTELMRKSVDKVEIRLVDGRTITAEQRKKAYALINDIARWSGHLPEEIKAYSKAGYCAESGEEDFSLGSCTVTTAREYISYLIEFCLRNEVPCMDLMGRAKLTANSWHRKGPRGECVCRHPDALETFKRTCPRSPRMPGFIAFTTPGESAPQIKTSPRWCPRRIR